MGERIKQLTADLAAHRDAFTAFYRGLSADELDVLVYTDDNQWRVRDLLAHVVTTERSLQWLYRNVAEGGDGTPDDFDLDYFNRRQVGKLMDTPLENLLTQFEAVRAETIALVEGFSEDALDNEGRHPLFGTLTLAEMVAWATKHPEHHLAHVRDALANA